MVNLKYDDFLEYDESTGTYSVPKDQQVRDEVEKNRWKETGLTILKDWRLYLMLVPMIFVYVLWKYFPMYDLIGAFKNTTTATSVSDQYWMGFTYFLDLIYAKSSVSVYFWNAFRNTFTTAFYGLLFGFPTPIILALFFNEVRSNVARNIMQVCVYLPKFLSTVVVTTLALSLFKNGSVLSDGSNTAGILTKAWAAITGNDSLISTGLVYSTSYYRAVYIITDLWEHAGYDSIVFFAAVIAVSPTSYEAAQIDGAGKMAQMRYVVLPSILSTVVIMLIMKIGSLLSVGYEKIYLLEGNGNYEVAEVVSTWANKQTGVNQMYGIAAEMMNNVIGMLLVIGSNSIARRASDVSLY